MLFHLSYISLQLSQPLLTKKVIGKGVINGTISVQVKFKLVGKGIRKRVVRGNGVGKVVT